MTKSSSCQAEFIEIQASQGMLDRCIQQAWNTTLKTVVPCNASVLWEVLRVELWLESGMIVFFPAKLDYRERIEKCGCVLISPELRATYEALADSGTSDEEFSDRMYKWEAEVWAKIKEMAPPEASFRKGIIYWSPADDEAASRH